MADPFTEFTNAVRNPGRAASDVANGAKRIVGDTAQGAGDFMMNLFGNGATQNAVNMVKSQLAGEAAIREDLARTKEQEQLAALSAGMQRKATGRASTILGGTSLSTSGTSAARVLLGA